MRSATYLLTAFLLTTQLAALLSADEPRVVTTPEGRELPFDPDWTPRPVEGDVPWYMKETDVEWVDPRLREMDTGRTFNATFRYRHGEKDETCFKGTAIRIGETGDAAVLFDRNQLRWACGWTCEPLGTPGKSHPSGFTPYLEHSDRRFGLLNTPRPQGEITFSTGTGPGCSGPEGEWQTDAPATAPLPKSWGRFHALVRFGDHRTAITYRVGDQTLKVKDEELPRGWVQEVPWMHSRYEGDFFTRAISIDAPYSHPVVTVLDTLGRKVQIRDDGDQQVAELTGKDGTLRVSLWEAASEPAGSRLIEVDGRLAAELRGNVLICIAKGKLLTAENFAEITRELRSTENPNVLDDQRLEQQIAPVQEPERFPAEAPPQEWPQIVSTKSQRSPDDAAYVIDTVTVPYENPFQSLMFLSGVAFVPRSFYSGWWASQEAAPQPSPESDDLAVVTTAHGDVWLVHGIDDDLDDLRWKRFAAGLYQPMGVKFIDGELYVLERGQLTILKDLDGNGEADVYQNFCGDWHVGGGEHSYHTSLETDLDGNFYFHCGGDTNTPTGGTLMQVSKDGERAQVYCTGFRHPIGLGALPDGRITGADQEGNWMPATRIDIYRPGGFYGDMRAHHREVDPDLYDQPLCWLPRQLDNSAGGQIFVDRDDFGPLSGRYLHLSYGKCRMMLLLMQTHAGIEQAGAIDLGLQFLSGIQRGTFRESDGHLYVVGMDGWQTAATADGCLQRVRYTGKDVTLPVGLTLERGGIRLEFNAPLDEQVAADARRYHIEQWNYRWSGEYGSKRWSVRDPEVEGQDIIPVAAAKVDDPWSVFLRTPQLQPVMQMQVEYDIAASDGRPIKGAIYNTVHTTGPALELLDGDRVALIGGTLIEREQRYGYWEHAITAAHPRKDITFRNLGWSADTVWAESRGIFDAPEKGYERLLAQVGELSPTVLVLNYGANEAWAGPDGVDRFITQYDKLLDDLSQAARGSGASAEQTDESAEATAAPRIVLLGPLPMEPGVGPNADPSEYNQNVKLYAEAIARLARKRDIPFIDLADVYDWHESQVDPVKPQPLTQDGLQLSEYGYWRTAPWIRERLCAGTESPTIVLPTAADAAALMGRFDPDSKTIQLDAVPEARQQQETVLVEFGGHLSSLPLPPLQDRPGPAPQQRYRAATPGSYRLDADGQPAAEGTDAEWLEGIVIAGGPDASQSRELLESILRKNELYFHRWRPQNVTYLFLFRKHEQGNNAVEIPQFDPLIAEEEAKIAKLREPQRRAFRLVREAD